MKETLDAIYENGVFKPLQCPAIPEGEQVRLVVEIRAEQISEDLLELAARVYEGLSEEEVLEIERVALARRDF